MSPVAVIAGTFLIWIAARKRFSQYADLVNKKGTTTSGVSPSASSGGDGASSNKELSAVVDTLPDTLANAWKGLG